jgi:predicted nucleic acid-binding Zn ribbon protein
MRSIQHTSAIVVRRLLADQPTTAAKVAFAWQMAVGAAMARGGEPEWLGQGILRVRTTSAHWHRELSIGRGVILERLAEILGRGVVTSLVIQEPEGQVHA